MKSLFMALALVLVSAAAFANGGPPRPVSQLPAWDGTYAPGSGPVDPTARTPYCGGQAGPCHNSTAPEYTGCKEGRHSVFTYANGTYQGRTQVTETIVVVCHNNEWIPVN
jgi:hypothetical protein